MNISNAFTNSVFKNFLKFAEEQSISRQEILQRTKQGKSQPLRQAIDDFGSLFIEEFYHFIKIYKIKTTSNSTKPLNGNGNAYAPRQVAAERGNENTVGPSQEVWVDKQQQKKKKQ